MICSNCLDGTNLSNQKHVKEYNKNKNKKNFFLNDVFEICHPNVQEGFTDWFEVSLLKDRKILEKL